MIDNRKLGFVAEVLVHKYNQQQLLSIVIDELFCIL